MILTCPSCDTRYTVDGSKFPATGRTVRCAKCGHSWFQAGEMPELGQAPESAQQAVPASVAPSSAESASQAAAADFAPQPVSQESTSVSRAVQAEEKPRAPLGPRIAVVAGWAGLILVVLLIAFAAVRYRQDIATIWPQSAGVYSSLGLHVNATGIDFRQVEYRRETEDGQVVLAVTGLIINGSQRELPVPQTVRVTLSDANSHELYHWTFKPTAQVLTPGQSIKFVTRLASPPAAARHLEVRFAKDGS